MADASFHVVNDSTGMDKTVPGHIYDGPVAGLDQQFIAITCDSLEITATGPNVFIHSGNGNDIIDLSDSTGNNVLDGTGGKNVLIGGTGHDTFFLDDRDADGNLRSVIQNFHSGDNVTVWGITPGDFGFHYHDSPDGLKITLAVNDKPDVKLTLAGYTASDLDSGRVTLTPGRSPNLPDLPGSPYLLIHAV